MGAGPPLVDWRSGASYAALHRCGRHGFAWEWLRRSPAYCAASGVGGGNEQRRDAAAFGLHRFECVDHAAPAARPVWRAEADPHVLVAMAGAGDGGADAFDVAEFGSLATCHIGPDGHEHWLLSDGWRHIRIDIVRGTLRRGPAHLDYRLAGLAHAGPRLVTLSRLIALNRTGRLAHALFPAERRASRWALVLRTYDALAAGAAQREIAEYLFDLGAMARWRIEAPSYRRRVQRLVQAARGVANADPRLWLSGAFP